MLVQMKQQAVIGFVTAESIHWQMKVVYREEYVEISTVWHWVAHVYDGKLGTGFLTLSDKQWMRMPGTAPGKAHQNCVDELIKGNHRVSEHEQREKWGLHASDCRQ
jgi:hypothetical protein